MTYLVFTVLDKINSTEIKNLRDLFTNKVTAIFRIVLLDETSKKIVLEKSEILLNITK